MTAQKAPSARYWRVNGKLHREDGPAIEHDGGGLEWYRNGRLHRLDGPAIERDAPTGSHWFVNGIFLNPQEAALFQTLDLQVRDLVAQLLVADADLRDLVAAVLTARSPATPPAPEGCRT
jgi:hypothetical protein